MKGIIVLALLHMAVAVPVSNVFEIDISPEEAQKYLANPPFNEPQLSGKTASLPLVRWNDPRFRAADSGPTNGHYWKNGHEIENTEDYVEDVYEASQYHGQDGLGQYAYGYSAPESSKVENREHSGDVRGSYTFKSGDDQIIKVRYWADSEGFHQEDNLPKVELQPIPESDDVREARLAHQKAWEEAAAAARANPDPQGDYDPSKYEYEGSASEQRNSIFPQESREAKAYSQQNQYAPAPAQPQSLAGQQQGVSGQYQGYGGKQEGFSGQKQGFSGQQQGFSGQQQGFSGQQQGFSGQQQGFSGQQQGFSGQKQGSSGQQGYGNQQQSFGGQQGFAGASNQGLFGQQQAQGLGYQQQPSQQAFASSSQSYNQKPTTSLPGFQSASYQPQQGYQAQSSASSSVNYQGQSQDHQAYQGQQSQESEPTGPPKGFFYSFNYPVSVLVSKNAEGHQGQVQPGHPVDHDTVGVSSYQG